MGNPKPTKSKSKDVKEKEKSTEKVGIRIPKNGRRMTLAEPLGDESPANLLQQQATNFRVVQWIPFLCTLGQQNAIGTMLYYHKFEK